MTKLLTHVDNLARLQQELETEEATITYLESELAASPLAFDVEISENVAGTLRIRLEEAIERRSHAPPELATVTTLNVKRLRSALKRVETKIACLQAELAASPLARDLELHCAIAASTRSLAWAASCNVYHNRKERVI